MEEALVKFRKTKTNLAKIFEYNILFLSDPFLYVTNPMCLNWVISQIFSWFYIIVLVKNGENPVFMKIVSPG